MEINSIICPICGSNSLTHYLDCTDYAVSRESFSLFKCQECELLITTPQPPKAALEKYYQFQDYVSHTGKGTNLINQIYLLARRYTLGQKLKLINQHAAVGKLLDIGCGTGNFLHACQQAGWNVAGIEPSEGARKLSMQVTKNISPTLDQHNGGQYDVITLWHVLEHLSDLNRNLAQIKAKLKHDGTLFIAVPNYKSHDSTLYAKVWAGYDVPRHLWHFSRKTIQTATEKHGLRLTHILPMKLDAYYVSLLSEKYKKDKLTLPGMINAVKTGLMSNLKARATSDYSSLIYIIKK